MYCHNARCSWKYQVNWLLHSDDLHHCACYPQWWIRSVNYKQKQIVPWLWTTQYMNDITSTPKIADNDWLTFVLFVSRIFRVSVCVSGTCGTLAPINCFVSIILLFKQAKKNNVRILPSHQVFQNRTSLYFCLKKRTRDPEQTKS